MPDLPKITCIICTHNRAHYLENCIQSLLNQTLDDTKYEVLVVDNRSTDGTAQVVDQFCKKMNFRYTYEPVLGLSSARNTGWKNALGEFVGYIDDDAVADPNWLENALWCFENVHPTPEWVGGPVEPTWEITAPTWLSREYWGALGILNWGDEYRFLEEKNQWLPGGNSFLSRHLLEEVGGFDTRLGRIGGLLLSGEELQLKCRVMARGGRLYYHPGVKIYHHVPSERTKKSYFYKRYYWGGVTDCIMRDTLDSYPAKLESNSAQSRISEQVKRVLKNSRAALGINSDRNGKIHGRIFMSYVFGYIAAKIGVYDNRQR